MLRPLSYCSLTTSVTLLVLPRSNCSSPSPMQMMGINSSCRTACTAMFGLASLEMPSTFRLTGLPFAHPIGTTILGYSRNDYSVNNYRRNRRATVDPLPGTFGTPYKRISHPWPDIKQLAQSLHLSVRTLNRRLQDEGSHFRQLKIDAIHEGAKRMLLEGVSVRGHCPGTGLRKRS